MHFFKCSYELMRYSSGSLVSCVLEQRNVMLWLLQDRYYLLKELEKCTNA